MRRAARLLAFTGLAAAIGQAVLWASRGGSPLPRLALLACGAGAAFWAAASRPPHRPAAALAAALGAGAAFWLGALELALLSRVLLARGLLALLALAALHTTVLFAGLARRDAAAGVLRGLVFAALALSTLAALEAGARALSPLRTYELIPDEPAAGPCLVRVPDGRLAGVPGCGGRYIHREFDGVRAEFNALGLRDGRDDGAPPAAGERSILVLGDSFAYGMGVELGETFQQLLEPRLRAAGLPARVYGAAMPGAGTAHERRVLEELAPLLAPEVVVLALFEDNDLQENWAAGGGRTIGPLPPAAPGSEADAPGTAARGTGPPTPWRFLASAAAWPFWRTTSSLLQLRRIDGRPTPVLLAAMQPRPSPTVESMLTAVLAQLDAIAALVRELDARLVVLLVPAIVQAEPPAFADLVARHPELELSRTAFHRRLASELGRRGHRLVDPLPGLEACAAAGNPCYHREGHWNARGHELAAELLAAELEPLLRAPGGGEPPAADPGPGAVAILPPSELSARP